jgi:hypothetical protein
MSRERELLKELHRAVDCEWLDEIEAVLAEPEQKPLTREEISYGFRTNDDAINAESFWAGVEWAEKMHGITGVDDETK